jgi:hypothetical protein
MCCFFARPLGALRGGGQESLAPGDTLGLLYNREVKEFAFKLGCRLPGFSASSALHATIACGLANGMRIALAWLGVGRSAAAIGNWRAR